MSLKRCCGPVVTLGHRRNRFVACLNCGKTGDAPRKHPALPYLAFRVALCAIIAAVWILAYTPTQASSPGSKVATTIEGVCPSAHTDLRHCPI